MASEGNRNILIGCLIVGVVLALVVGVVLVAALLFWVSADVSMPLAEDAHFELELEGYSAAEIEELLFDVIPNLTYDEIAEWQVTSRAGGATIVLTRADDAGARQFDVSAELAIAELMLALPSETELASQFQRSYATSLPEKSELVVKLDFDEDKLTAFGLEEAEILLLLEEGNAYDSPQQIGEFIVNPEAESPVTLEQVANVRLVEEPSILVRFWPDRR